MISINYRDERPIYLQIKEGFVKLIATGALAPGDRMPSVRELAGELAINPNTIQRAYRELEAEGFITTAAGKGCFVMGTPDADERQNRELLEQFDRCCEQLLYRGVGAAALCERIDRIRNGGATK